MRLQALRESLMGVVRESHVRFLPPPPSFAAVAGGHRRKALGFSPWGSAWCAHAPRARPPPHTLTAAWSKLLVLLTPLAPNAQAHTTRPP